MSLDKEEADLSLTSNRILDEAKAAMFLDVFENLRERYQNDLEVYRDIENVLNAAGNIGSQMYHARRLRGNSDRASYTSHKAFERAIISAAMSQERAKSQPQARR